MLIEAREGKLCPNTRRQPSRGLGHPLRAAKQHDKTEMAMAHSRSVADSRVRQVVN